MRDRLIIGVANWLLRTFATKKTAAMIAGSIEYGLRAAARDERAGTEPPPDWRYTFPVATGTVYTPDRHTARTINGWAL